MSQRVRSWLGGQSWSTRAFLGITIVGLLAGGIAAAIFWGIPPLVELFRSDEDVETLTSRLQLILAALAFISIIGGAILWFIRQLRPPSQPPVSPEPAPPSTPAPPPSPDAAPVWNVRRHIRNPNFTGRTETLQHLRQHLEAGKSAALTAIHGMGGVGKTQIAIEYSYSHRSDYEVIWWVRSEEAIQLASDFAGLAVEVGAAGAEEANQEAQISATKAWLENHGNWLLVFDNVPRPQDVVDYLPSTERGHILITSRYQDWRGIADAFPVEKWAPEVSVAFLLKRTGHAEEGPALALAKELDNLPLALEQAAAYIGKSGCSLDHYLDLFREHQNEMMEEGEPPQNYDKTVATTWGLSLDKAGEEEPAAVELMHLCAFFAPDDIPLDVIRKGAEFLPEALAEAAGHDMAWDRLATTLRSYSLAEVSGDSLSLHRLVQAVVQGRLDEDEVKEVAEAALLVVNAAIPTGLDNLTIWDIYDRLLPHALSVSIHTERRNLAGEATERILTQVGTYMQVRARFDEAKSALTRALNIAEKIYGPDHPDVAIDLNNLGSVFRLEGDLTRANEHYERALRIQEANYGPDHPNAATGVNNLGRVLYDKGDLAGARSNFERALRIDEAAYGSDHPQVAIRLSNLGSVLNNQDDLVGAEALYERALKIDEAAFGPVHPRVATRLNNLGTVFAGQGDVARARTHFEQAFEILRQILGADHPDTLKVQENLDALPD